MYDILGVYPVVSVLGHVPGLEIHSFAFKPSLIPDLERANLVISHCGAGSILEILRHGKVAVGVINSSLMDNHQKELADIIHTEQLMAIAESPDNLVCVLESTVWGTFKKVDSTKSAQASFSKEIFNLLSL